MRLAVIIVLFIFWMVLAYYRFKAGDMVLAGVFVLVGIVLTTYRVLKMKG